jgi:hypothetical protein
MDWELEVFSSEALVVETPDTPECVPAVIDHLTISRNGLGQDKVKYDFNGRLSFASFMWEKSSFSRERVTEDFTLSSRYIYAKDEHSNEWTTDVEMKIDSLDATITRKQFIFLQSILDNQLADIRDVSAKVCCFLSLIHEHLSAYFSISILKSFSVHILMMTESL